MASLTGQGVGVWECSLATTGRDVGMHGEDRERQRDLSDYQNKNLP